jgi:hypothetical protein
MLSTDNIVNFKTAFCISKKHRNKIMTLLDIAYVLFFTSLSQFPTNDLWPPYSDPNSVGSVFRASILAILESGFCLAAITTVSIA